MTPEERQTKHDLIEEGFLTKINNLVTESYQTVIPEGHTRGQVLAEILDNYKEFIKCRQFGRTISKREMDGEDNPRTTTEGGDEVGSLFGNGDDKEN